MITIFTPTYNRAYIIENLYRSLCIQTCKDFEWVIVDDGSVDNTQELIKSFIEEKKILIRYKFQKNRGKHIAINNGVSLAHGELFFIVDSDDQLMPNSIEIIYDNYLSIINDNNFGGLSGLRASSDGKRIGGEVNFDTLDCSSLDFRMKYHINGDMAEVFRTEILRNYPFPEIEGEKFCPEALVWNRISQKYKLHYFNKKIYLCDYLSDGLTAKITKIRMESPIASTKYYSELSQMDIPIIQKIKAAINYWRFYLCKPNQQKTKLQKRWLFTFPIGIIMHIKDKKK